MACSLLVIQRMDKASQQKTPSCPSQPHKKAQAKASVSREVLDQIDAFLGPVLLYLVMLFQTDGSTFQASSTDFAFLAIPGALTIILLLVIKLDFPTQPAS